MAIQYCEYCDEYIDLDYNVDHWPDGDSDKCVNELDDDPPVCRYCEGTGQNIGIGGGGLITCRNCKGKGVEGG